MRKRMNSEEGSEMEVDNEERKVDVGEYDGIDDDSDEMESTGGAEQSENEEDEDRSNAEPTAGPTSVVENPFLDSFYSLSAPNPKERSRAAQVMLHHCLLGPESNSKDAAYAFRRLLNGLCSGRAAARQGNASALASFLKIAFQLDKMDEIRNEAQKGDENTSSLLSYVRDRLISATDAHKTEGKKKGSEERDYHFGRLFGILGVVRSRILLLSGDDDEIKEVASALVGDLVDLFWHKRWMREPAAHGITAMLNLFFESGRKGGRKIGWHLVKEVIVPKVLIVMQGDKSEENDFQTILEKSCAEQIGIAAYIQSQPQAKKLPFPLDKPFVSTQTIPVIGQALSETSVIVQPRTHFVWDALWCYLTEKDDEQDSKNNSKNGASSKYCIRTTTPLGEDRVTDVIDAIMKVVVEEKLLRIEKESSIAKATHERKALALCIVRNLSGVPFVSSISGPTQISMPSDSIENILLTKDIVKFLFLDVISAGKKKKDASHLLKPLALKVLESWVQSINLSGDMNRQLACAKAITNCHPRFDTLTKTKTLSELLLPSKSTLTTAAQYTFLGKYFDHLENKFLELCHSTEASNAEAHGYAELMYTSAKQILHKPSEGEEDGDPDIIGYKKTATKRILGFFMSIAFFDCSTMKRTTKEEIKGASESAFRVQSSLQTGEKVAYPIRVMVSSRFFALVSDFVTTISHESVNEENAKLEKDSNALALLEEICEDWIELESNKATRFIAVDNDDEEQDEDDGSPERIISELRSKVAELKENTGLDNDSKKRCMIGITVLSITLHLHRLSCGSNDESDEMDDNPDADEEEDEENICSAIVDLKSVASDFFGEENDSNPLLGLAEICTNILSSPLGSGDIGRGAAPKLVREAVKYAWLGGLKLASTMATKDKTLLDDSVVGLLLDAIGAADTNDDIQDDDDAEMSDDDEEEESEEESDDDLVFTKASKVLNDSDDMEEDERDAPEAEDDESDIELDPSKLNTMLEDDNLDDIDDIPLEHHEGADAALAKLIKMKQEARKAGQEAREKIEMANQLRCTMLIDLLLGRPDSWNKLFQSNVILKMVLPLLESQKRIGVSTQRASEGKAGTAEKKALLHRLTSLIKQKLSKIRRSSMPLSSPVDMNIAKTSFQSIMKEAKNSKDKEYLSCCSSSLVFLLRMMPKSPELVSFVSVEYGTLVSDWSTKRNNGASLLEDLITQMPALAQASLAIALSSATQEARGFYLKFEAYRLMSLLFANKHDTEGSTDMEKLALSKIHESQDDLLSDVNKTLSNEEVIKPKFAKAVFKTLEKMLPFVSPPASSGAKDLMTAIKIEISGLGDKQKELTAAAGKLVEQVDSRLEELNAAAAKSAETKTKSQSSTKSKKKKKKKKR